MWRLKLFSLLKHSKEARAGHSVSMNTDNLPKRSYKRSVIDAIQLIGLLNV